MTDRTDPKRDEEMPKAADLRPREQQRRRDRAAHRAATWLFEDLLS
jgi:hypothetical protein